MMQWATFLPVLRSHGTDTYREPWYFGEPGTPYYDAIIDMIHLRYRLIPYTYSLAAKQTFEHYTMVRLLAFDFPTDSTVLDIGDQYMYGRILVCPVTTEGVTTRRVYLPQTPDGRVTWIDYWTGHTYHGGQWVEASAPLHRLPLFVRGGSLIPTTEVAQHSSAQHGLPLTVHVYPGADATFTLYDDEGDSYRYEQGVYSTITLRWDDSRRILHIGPRKGIYPGMPSQRTLVISTPWGNKTVEYIGEAMSIDVQ